MANPWTTKELAVLRVLYPVGGTEAVFHALHGKHPRGSIKTTAWRFRITCDVPLWKLRKPL